MRLPVLYSRLTVEVTEACPRSQLDTAEQRQSPGPPKASSRLCADWQPGGGPSTGVTQHL